MRDADLTAAGPNGAAGIEADRDAASGRFIRGNRAALVCGHRSGAFWAAAEATEREITAAAIRDAGYAIDDCPAVLARASAAFARASLMEEASFRHVASSDGPLTAAGRTRRAFNVWQQSSARVSDLARLLGLRRAPRPVPTLDEVLNGIEEQP
jgi:hypothetical protein